MNIRVPRQLLFEKMIHVVFQSMFAEQLYFVEFLKLNGLIIIFLFYGYLDSSYIVWSLWLGGGGLVQFKACMLIKQLELVKKWGN